MVYRWCMELLHDFLCLVFFRCELTTTKVVGFLYPYGAIIEIRYTYYHYDKHTSGHV